MVLDTHRVEVDSMICAGEVVTWNGAAVTSTGMYLDTLSNANGCDSIVVLDLMVLDTHRVEVDSMICAGELVTWNGAAVTSTGMYLDTLSNANGCDSIVVLDLMVLDTHRVEVDSMICAGEVVTWNGSAVTSTGMYLDTLSNVNAVSYTHLTLPTTRRV